MEVHNPYSNTYFYYYRDKDNRPLVTVCLIESSGILCRGIAICSPKDNPCKAEGRDRALYKALRAFKKGESGCPIKRFEATHVLHQVKQRDLISCNKSAFNVLPWNDFERKIVYGDKNEN